MTNNYFNRFFSVAFVGFFLLFSHASFSQNLIERTLLQLPTKETTSSNAISEQLANRKNTERVNLFQSQVDNPDKDVQEIELNVIDDGYSKLKEATTKNIDVALGLSSSATLNLKLQRVNIFTEDATLKDQTGKSYPLERPQTYRGIVNDDPNSIVSLSIIGKKIHISISDNEGTYVVSANDQKTYKLFVDHSLEEGRGSCENPDDDSMLGGATSQIQGTNNKGAGDIVEVFVECDYRMFQNEGGVTQTQNYVNSLFNEIATLYSNENITLQVSDVLIWTSPDPHTYTFPVSFGALQDYGEERQNNYNGRLAALLQGHRNSSCSVSGIAWINVLCSSYNSNQHSGPYSVTAGLGNCPLPTYPSYSVDVSIVAHELGHNFGSRHTHYCAWGPQNDRKIDACATESMGNSNCSLVQSPTPPSELGTIMSYCNNIDFTKGFGTEPGALIYNNYVAAGCLTPGNTTDPCTHVNRTYTNTTISGAPVVRADNNITFNGSVQIANFSNIFLQAENSFTINGTLNMPPNAQLIIVAEDCD